VVSAIVSLAWAIVSGIVSLAVFVGVVYVLYKTGAWLFGDDDADYSVSDSLGRSRSSSHVGVGWRHPQRVDKTGSAGSTSRDRSAKRSSSAGSRASWRPRNPTISIGSSTISTGSSNGTGRP